MVRSIWCQLPDSKKLKIDLDSTAHVCDLQKAIKDANQNRLRFVDAVDIDLFCNKEPLLIDMPISKIDDNYLVTVFYPLYSQVPLNQITTDHSKEIDLIDHVDHTNMMEIWKDHGLNNFEFENSIFLFGEEPALGRDLDDLSDSQSLNFDHIDTDSADFDVESSLDGSLVSDSDSSVIFLGITPTNHNEDYHHDTVSAEYASSIDNSDTRTSVFDKLSITDVNTSELYKSRSLETSYAYPVSKQEPVAPNKGKRRIETEKEEGFTIFATAQRGNYCKLYRTKSENVIDNMLLQAWNMLPAREKEGFNYAARKRNKKPRRRLIRRS